MIELITVQTDEWEVSPGARMLEVGWLALSPDLADLLRFRLPFESSLNGIAASDKEWSISGSPDCMS